MKLQCQVDVINRLHNALNVRTNGKYSKSTLALGMEIKENGYFILLFSSVNKNGARYKVKNIKQVFVKYLNEGKATIRFEEPPHDLLIKAEVLQLKCFMKLLKSCITGDNKVDLLNLSNISVVSKDIAPTKLVVRNRNEFPPKGLPRTLESLFINGLKLCNFRRDILMLRHLVVLDLSNNEIEKIPYEFGRMPSLCALNLANNKLGVQGNMDWRWLLGPQITETLNALDLSANSLASLPKDIWKLKKLASLKLDNNVIDKLPSTIGRIRSLRYLTISRNQLKRLPCSLMQCRLDYIDLSFNQFKKDNANAASVNNNSPWDLYVGSLADMSSKVVLRHGLHYAPDILPWTLVQYLDNANMCVCGAPVLKDVFSLTKEFKLRDFFSVVVFDNNRDSTVMFDCYYCSVKCFSRR